MHVHVQHDEFTWPNLFLGFGGNVVHTCTLYFAAYDMFSMMDKIIIHDKEVYTLIQISTQLEQAVDLFLIFHLLQCCYLS